MKITTNSAFWFLIGACDKAFLAFGFAPTKIRQTVQELKTASTQDQKAYAWGSVSGLVMNAGMITYSIAEKAITGHSNLLEQVQKYSWLQALSGAYEVGRTMNYPKKRGMLPQLLDDKPHYFKEGALAETERDCEGELPKKLGD